jgi:hypothetical protein
MWLVRLLPAFDADYSDGPTRGNVSTQRIHGMAGEPRAAVAVGRRRLNRSRAPRIQPRV